MKDITLTESEQSAVLALLDGALLECEQVLDTVCPDYLTRALQDKIVLLRSLQGKLAH